mmetsp:Transcript_9111/g.38599  ORF Transcript_9111/g.38599 Transcript_9111/m.38599 type:complete len:242 (+) Transcript_9111:1030-1755(+)
MAALLMAGVVRAFGARETRRTPGSRPTQERLPERERILAEPEQVDPLLLHRALRVRELVLRDHRLFISDVYEFFGKRLPLDVRADGGVHEHRLAVHQREVAAVHLHRLGALRRRERRVQGNGDFFSALGTEPQRDASDFAHAAGSCAERASHRIEAEPAVRGVNRAVVARAVKRHQLVARRRQNPLGAIGRSSARFRFLRRGVPRTLSLESVVFVLLLGAAGDQIIVELRGVERRDAERHV